MKIRHTTFYDDHPSDWTEGFTRDDLDATLAPLLAAFIRSLSAGPLVLDVGCGAGRVMSCLAARGLRAVGLDLSSASVRVMASRTSKPGLVGNCLQLPFADASIDREIADGVIHHTSSPLKAFGEGCRILKPGGLFYVAVYKPGGRYQKLYRFPGGIIRRLMKTLAGKMLVHATFLPLYFLVHFAKSGGKRSWQGAKNLFYDYFVTPIVEFISYDEVQEWCSKCNAEIERYDPNPPLNVHSFVVRKRIHQLRP